MRAEKFMVRSRLAGGRDSGNGACIMPLGAVNGN